MAAGYNTTHMTPVLHPSSSDHPHGPFSMALSLHPEVEVLRQRVLGLEAREEEEASAGGVPPLSEEELRAAANVSTDSVPVSAVLFFGKTPVIVRPDRKSAGAAGAATLGGMRCRGQTFVKLAWEFKSLACRPALACPVYPSTRRAGPAKPFAGGVEFGWPILECSGQFVKQIIIFGGSKELACLSQPAPEQKHSILIASTYSRTLQSARGSLQLVAGLTESSDLSCDGALHLHLCQLNVRKVPEAVYTTPPPSSLPIGALSQLQQGGAQITDSVPEEEEGGREADEAAGQS
eukprot:1148256-Pelagomonas_calceolata.AAC.4